MFGSEERHHATIRGGVPVTFSGRDALRFKITFFRMLDLCH